MDDVIYKYPYFKEIRFNGHFALLTAIVINDSCFSAYKKDSSVKG